MRQQSQSSGKSGGCETEMMKQWTMQILNSELSYPDVHFSRKKPLWDSESVEQSSSDVESSHEQQPAQASLAYRLLHS